MVLSYRAINSFNRCKRKKSQEKFIIIWQVKEAGMSHLSYFSDMFHSLGNSSIELDNAMNTLVRSYRTDVLPNVKEQAKEKLLSLLSLLCEDDEEPVSPGDQQIKKALKDFMMKQDIISRVDLIREKIESEEKLSELEIAILDDVISQISRQATVAFRRMRKAV